MNKTITRLWKQAQEYGIATDVNDFLLLAYDPSPWKSELFLAITKTHPEADNLTRLTGKFVSKVFDGPYQAVPRYIKELDEYLGKSNRKAKKYYFYYTTCPKCAKKYAHNYIVAFAEV